MNNKELIQNYIDSYVSESRRPTWNWLLDSDIADDNESGLTYAPGTIQEAILSDTRGKKTKSMNSIKKRYDQLVKLYTYAYEQNYIKYNPFVNDKFINLQLAVDIYFSNRVNVNYVTPDKINAFISNLMSCNASADTKLNTRFHIVSLYNGINGKELRNLKFSDINQNDLTIFGKPVSKDFIETLNEYKLKMGDTNIYDDFVLIPRKKCNNIEEYQAEQKRIYNNVQSQLELTGNTLSYEKLTTIDVINSGFIQYLKSKMDIKAIADLYYIKSKEGIARSVIARQFSDIAIDFYYNYYISYRIKKKQFSDRQTVIGKSIGYLYKDEDYKNYRVHQIMAE